MTDQLPTRVLQIPGATNIRDLGGYRTVDGHLTQWRRVLRGDSPHLLSDEGNEALRQAGLRSLIDLRSDNELHHEPNPFKDSAQVAYHPLPLFDDLAPTMSGIKARDLGTNDLLYEFYLQALGEKAEAVRNVLTTIAEAPEGTVMFHCTVGKDRTGIIAALLLGAADVERGDIIADYAMTQTQISPLVERLLEQTRKHGGDVATHARFLRCEAPTMEATLDHILTRHGSIKGYLSDIGLKLGEINALKDRLLAA